MSLSPHWALHWQHKSCLGFSTSLFLSFSPSPALSLSLKINKHFFIKKKKPLRILRNYYGQLYSNTLDKLEEMDIFLETCNLPRSNHRKIENLNRPITSKEQGKVQDQMASLVNSTKHFFNLSFFI